MRRFGFSLLELLVATAIIAVLTGLLLPALQAAREASRRTQCTNNLKQIGIGVLAHHDAQRHFPLGGWGHEWIGAAERGFGHRQPGGWIYNALPYLEQGGLRRLASNGRPEAYAALVQTSLPVFTCPTRRPCAAWSISPRFPYMSALKPVGAPQSAGRSDYAVNGGATLPMSHPGPSSLADGDSATYPWPNLNGIGGSQDTVFSGISHLRIAAELRQLEDGASHTYLVGEKYLDPVQYESGESLGDNESLYSGYCSDNHRFGRLDLLPAMDGTLPLSDLLSHYRFGAAHPAGWTAVFCDGSVRLTGFDLEAEAHYLSSHRADLGLAPVK